MKITFIHHSAFMVELKTAALLFDYTEGDIPDILEDKPLLIFASHRHGDHYSDKILDIRKKCTGIIYVLSDDIPRKNANGEGIEDIIYMSPGESKKIPLTADRSAEAEVITCSSTDEGVAFLVKVEDKVIYHGGDLNNWRWEGEPEDWNENMAKRYSNEVNKLSDYAVDVAFLPLDPRQEEAFCLGFDEFMRKVHVSHAFPMHCWGDFSVINKLKNMELSDPYKNKIVEIQKDGDFFEIG